MRKCSIHTYTEETVAVIKALRKLGFPQKYIARRLKISKNTISVLANSRDDIAASVVFLQEFDALLDRYNLKPVPSLNSRVAAWVSKCEGPFVVQDLYPDFPNVPKKRLQQCLQNLKESGEVGVVWKSANGHWIQYISLCAQLPVVESGTNAPANPPGTDSQSAGTGQPVNVLSAARRWYVPD